LGVAHRTVSVEFEQIKRLQTHHKYLPLSIKAIGDWICIWERGTRQPSEEQIQNLIKIFGGGFAIMD